MSAAQPLSVLVIDDEPEMADMIAFCLRKRGARVTTCTRGRDAIPLAQATSFQLVICDLKMPDWDGLQTVRGLRSVAPDAQFVIATGYADEHTTVEARALGVAEQLAKPFTVDELHAAVTRVMGRG